MPGSTLPNTGVVLPTVRGDVGTWGNEVNDALSNYDAHDHKAGAGARITTAAINIDADLSFSSLYGASNLQRAQFSATALPANNLSMFVSNGTGGLAAGELYFRNNVGTPIRFTSGNTLNFASFVGGIGGDYASVGALEAFDDSQKQYTFKDGTIPQKWARLHAGNVRFAPFGTTSSFFVEMAAPAGLGSNYTLTWPTTLPGSGSLVQVSNAGQLSFSDAVAASTITASSTITATGLVTANAGLTAGANQKIRVSGTGSFPHGTFTAMIPASEAQGLPGVSANLSTSGMSFNAASSIDVFAISLRFTLGKRILAIRTKIVGSTTSTINSKLVFLPSTGVPTTVATSNTSVASTTTQTLSINSLASLFVANTYYSLFITMVSPGAGCVLLGFEVDYDEP